MLPLYTRWLTTSDYGSVDLITTYSALLLGIISCSIYDSIFIFPKDKLKEEKKKYLSSGLFFWLVSIIITGLLCWLLKVLGGIFHWHGFIIEYLWWIYGVLAINYIQSIFQQFLRAIDKMLVYSVTGIVSTVAIVGFGFLFIPSRGVNGYILSIITANVVSILYSIWQGKLYQYISISRIKSSTLLEMLHYSVPLIPNGVMWFMISSLNRPLLENYVGLAGVGIFAVASKFPNLLNTVYLLFQNAWLISVLEESKKDTYEVFYNRMLKFVVFGQTILAISMAIFSRWIIKIFAAEDFYTAWQYIPLMVISVIYMNVATFIGSNFAVTRESKYYFYSTVWAGITSLILNFALIPLFGLWGACFAMIISQIICLVARIKYSWHTVHITSPRFFLITNIFLFAICGVCIVFSPNFIYWTVIIILITLFFLFNKKYLLTACKLIQNIYGRYKLINKN